MTEMVAPQQSAMDYTSWTPEQVAAYFEEHGLSGYKDIFVDNELSGERVVLMTVDDIPDLNIAKVGHRVGFLKILRNLKTQVRMHLRKVELAREEEAYNGCAIGEKIFTCFGICPRDPDQYILRAGKLQIKEYELTRICGSFKCVCLGGEWHNDNITLDRIKDVDTEETTSGLLCCKIHKTKIDLAVSAGVEAEEEDSRVVQKEMFVEGAVGQKFADRILEAIENYATQQRGSM